MNADEQATAAKLGGKNLKVNAHEECQLSGERTVDGNPDKTSVDYMEHIGSHQRDGGIGRSSGSYTQDIGDGRKTLSNGEATIGGTEKFANHFIKADPTGQASVGLVTANNNFGILANKKVEKERTLHGNYEGDCVFNEEGAKQSGTDGL